MRKIFWLFVLPCVAAMFPRPSLHAGDFKLEPGFILLFNGKNLDGWQPKGDKKTKLDGQSEAFKGRFKVKDGMLIIDPMVKGGAYIETQRVFEKDVTIRFDFNAGEKCNNDLFIRGTKFDIVPGNKELKNVKMGEWYTMEIVVAGDKVIHKVNGETARTSKAKAGPSTFVVRAEFGAMQIKNLRVKE